MYLKMKERAMFAEMPHDRLVALSNEKNRQGCATKDALKAQQYLWEVNGEQFRGRSEWRED